MLSVVVPAYNETGAVGPAVQAIGKVLRDGGIPYELVFVDDGSTDCTWEEITKAAEQDPAVRGVSFSRNFGKEAAIFAGMEAAVGDCCAVMDCDLQQAAGDVRAMAAGLGGCQRRESGPKPGERFPRLCRQELLPDHEQGRADRYVPGLRL